MTKKELIFTIGIMLIVCFILYIGNSLLPKSEQEATINIGADLEKLPVVENIEKEPIIVGDATFTAEPLTIEQADKVLNEIQFTKDEEKVYKKIFKDKKKIKFDLSIMSVEEAENILLGILLKLGDNEKDITRELIEKGKIDFDKRVINLSKKI